MASAGYEVTVLTAKKRKKHDTSPVQDKAMQPSFDDGALEVSPKQLSKRLREMVPVAERDPLADAEWGNAHSQADYLDQTPSPRESRRRSPRTPEISAPPKVRPRKLTFGMSEGAKELPSENLPQLDSLDQRKESRKDENSKGKRRSPRKVSYALNSQNKPMQDNGKLRRKGSCAEIVVLSPSTNTDELLESIARRQSPRLVQMVNIQEKPCKKKQSKKKCKNDQKPENGSAYSKKKSMCKGGKVYGKSGSKVLGSTTRRPQKIWLRQVVVDRTKFQVGDDVYVKRIEDDFDEEEEGCLICGKAGKLIECDGCSGGVHMKCVDPPLDEVPDGDWICPSCVKTTKPGSDEGPMEVQSSQKQTNHPLRKPRTAREMLMMGELWAARIERLWRDRDGSYWFKGRWYLIPEETAVGRQAHNLRRELFRTNQSDENEMTSILRHCSVMCPEDFRNSGREGDDVFLCEYEYDTQFQTFKRISDIDEDAQVSCDELSDSFQLSEEDEEESEDEDRGCKRRSVHKRDSEKSQKPLTSARAANVRSSRMVGIGRVGAKTIPEGARKRPVTDFERAKAALRLTAAPNSLPCREKEMREISAFVTDAVVAGDRSLGHCLYISGVPGTGKTATVLEVMQKLRSRVEEGNLHPYRFVEINGLRLTSPEHVYTVLHEALTGHHLGWKKALQLLDERFSNSKPSKRIDARPCILLVDELDLLVTRNQSVLYNIFDWPTRPHSRLFVIGIANTIDLPERLLPRIASRMGLQRVSFSPYSHEQLQEIISARLEAINAFEKQAIEFASRKVAAVSGDARRALELCRRSVEVAEACCLNHPDTTCSGSKSQALQGLQISGKLVSMADVEDAIKEMFLAPHIKMMGRCTKQAKIFLVSMVHEQHKTGMAETTFEKVAMTFSCLCKSNSESILDWDTLLSIGCGLGTCRLILCEPGTQHRLQKLQLNFPSDDVSFALKEDREIPWLGKYL